MDDFANYPKSVNELTYDKKDASGDTLWGVLKPRDVLISLLRDIDEGKMDIDAVAVCISGTDNDGGYCTMRTAAKSFYEEIGLLQRCLTLRASR